MSTSDLPTPSADPSRRAQLLAIKLRALVTGLLGPNLAGGTTASATADTSASFGRGAAMVVDGVAWVLLDDQPERGLGAALAWAVKQPDAHSLAVMAETATGVLARRATLFEWPITVLKIVGRNLLPATAEPYDEVGHIDIAHHAVGFDITRGGAEAVVESGVIAGEVRGLEICRVVDDPFTNAVRLEVGVGVHDRESFKILHGNRPTIEALADVVAAVDVHRQLGAPPHPLNRLAAERFLRWQLLDSPSVVGAASLQRADPPVPRRNLKDPVPCVAVGELLSGEPLVAVCSVGIDLDLVPFAADARAMHSPAAALLLVIPHRDAVPITRRLASLARIPAGIHTWV